MIILGMALAISSVYVYLISHIYIQWKKILFTNVIPALTSTKVSIIIAARNESKCIKDCIESILSNELSGNTIEIIIIDDQSIDDTFDIVENIHSDLVSIYRLPDGKTGKKEAISYGVGKAIHPIILCTDADCIVGRYWVQSHLNTYREGNVQMATSLIMPKYKDTILANFQSFDFAATMVMTAVGIQSKSMYLANGANMSFRKATFLRLRAYDKNQHLASGDDVFLIQSVANDNPDVVHFIKSPECTVLTNPEETWTNLVIQRIRWASKSTKIKNNFLISLHGFIFLYTVTVFVLLTLYFYVENIYYLAAALFLVIIKYIVDYVFLRKISSELDPLMTMKYFPICFILYFAHIIGSGITALFPYRYMWKGRMVR